MDRSSERAFPGVPCRDEFTRESAVRFLNVAYETTDWVAIFLKSYESGRIAQRVGPIRWAMSQHCQSWLLEMNGKGFNVYVSVNGIAVGRRARTRDSINSIRHVFLEADRDGETLLAHLERRRDLPAPSYVLHSSPGRLHLFWRATGFDGAYLERLQRQLANELGTDRAATPITQMTRLPGFFNYKHRQPHLVAVDYRDVDSRFGPESFPAVRNTWPELPVRPMEPRGCYLNVVERAKRYLASVPPAISGQHGDVHTFRVCCRLTRGFALDAEQALAVLSEWNARCEPPWTTSELLDKLRRAARSGREPVGGLL